MNSIMAVKFATAGKFCKFCQFSKAYNFLRPQQNFLKFSEKSLQIVYFTGEKYLNGEINTYSDIKAQKMAKFGKQNYSC